MALTCPSCTFINPPKTKNCQVCATALEGGSKAPPTSTKPPASAPSPASTGVWDRITSRYTTPSPSTSAPTWNICRVCTYRYEGSTCEVCAALSASVAASPTSTTSFGGSGGRGTSFFPSPSPLPPSSPLQGFPSGLPPPSSPLSRPPRGSASPTTKSRVCPFCTFINGSGSTECSACERELPPDNSWLCPMCTYVNVALTTVCHVCHHVKDGESPGKGPSMMESRDTDNDSDGTDNSESSSAGSQTVAEEPFHRSLSEYDVEAEIASAAAETWQAVAASCRASNSSFEDAEFPANDLSLATDSNLNLQWRRPSKIKSSYKGNWRVFGASLQPSDIQQRELGDCWFLSALAVLCERPELVLKVMMTHEVNEEGIYQVRFCKNGVWVVVTIDDLLPVKSDGRLAFAQAPEKTLYVALIEKAYAKLHGSYGAIVSGLVEDALMDLTGAPCETIRFSEELDVDFVWASLLSSASSSFLLAASCGGTQLPPHAHEEVGLSPSHCYSILAVKTVSVDGSGTRLIQLRNPHGVGKWKGDWSDSSPLWTAEIRNEVGARPPRATTSSRRGFGLGLGLARSSSARGDNDDDDDDGVFWMSFADVMMYFSSITIARVRTEWCEARVRTDFGYANGDEIKRQFSMGLESEYMFVLEISRPTQVVLSLTLEDMRGRQDLPQSSRDHHGDELDTTGEDSLSGSYPPLTLLVVSQTETGVVHPENVVSAEETQGSCRFLSLETHLTDDTMPYIVFPAAPRFGSPSLFGDISMPVVFTVHSSHRVRVKKVPFDNHLYVLALHRSAVHAVPRGPKALKSTHTVLYPNVLMHVIHRGETIMFVVENGDKKLRLEIGLDNSRSRNVTSTRGSLVCQDSVPPKHCQILMILSAIEAHGGYSWGSSYTYQQVRNEPRCAHMPPLKDVDLHQPLPINQ